MKSARKRYLYLTTESEDHTQTRQFQFGQILKISRQWQDNLSYNLVLICVYSVSLLRVSDQLSESQSPRIISAGNHPLGDIWIIKLTLINAIWARCRQLLECSVPVMLSVAIMRSSSSPGWWERWESSRVSSPALMRGGPGLMSDCYEYYFLLSAVRASEII